MTRAPGKTACSSSSSTTGSTTAPTNTPIPTTIISKIPTTLPETTIINIPSTKKEIISTTIPIINPSTVLEPINYNICTYYVYLHYNCSFLNLSNFGILSKLKEEMLRTYPSNGINVEINALDGYAFQITNSLNQLVSNDSAFSNIDLGDCERLLKETYGIDQSLSLIYFKFEKAKK